MATAISLPMSPVHFPGVSVTSIPPIRSNQGQYIATDSVGLLKPTPINTPIEEIRKRYQQDGYVLVKGVIPREDVLDMREHYFTTIKSIGIIKPGTNPRDGIFDSSINAMAHQGIGGALSSDESEVKLLHAAHSTPEYLAFSQHPALRAFVRKFMGWEDDVECVRTLLRHNLPHSASTAIHYDKIFLRGSESDFLTAWVPIGDCAANGGGLLYLEQSTELGSTIEDDFSTRAQILTPAERISAYNVHMSSTGTLSHDAAIFGKQEGQGKRWLTANYEAGDVVFHNPYIIHTSGKNEDSLDRIRLSTDLRFYEKGAPVDERWMNKWSPDDRI